MSFLFLAGFGVGTLDSGDIERRRHIVNNSVKKLLYALVSVRSTADNGNELVFDRALSDGCSDFLSGEICTLVLEVSLHEVVVKLGYLLEKVSSVFLSLFLHILGNLFHAHILAEVIIVYICVHLNEVDDASEGRLSADRQLNRNSVALQSVVHHVYYVVEVCTHNIHLIYISHSGYVVVVRLAPNCFRLRLNAALSAEYSYRAIEDAQRTLNFNSKVNVAGGIDNIDTNLVILAVIPERGGRSRSNGYTSLLLLNHPVHRSRTIMGFTNLVVNTCIEQYTLGGSGLTGIDMSHYTNITGHFERNVSFHKILHIVAEY